MHVSNKQPVIRVKQKRKKFIKVIPSEKKDQVLSQGGDVLKKVNFINKHSQSTKAINKGFEPLKPLKPVMIAGLKTKGLPVPKTLPLIAEKFYNEVVRNAYKTRTQRFSDAGMRPVDVMSTTSNDAFDTAKNAVLDGIISFVKNVKSKKESGGNLSKIEENVYNATKAVEGNIEKQAKAEASQQLGAKILFDPKVRTILIVLVLGIVGYMIFK